MVVVDRRHCIAPSFSEQFLGPRTQSWEELGGGGKTRDKAMNSNFPTLAGDLHLSLG